MSKLTKEQQELMDTPEKRKEMWPRVLQQTKEGLERALAESDKNGESGGSLIHYPTLIWLELGEAKQIFIEKGYDAFREELGNVTVKIYEQFFGPLTEEEKQLLNEGKDLD